MKRVLLAEDDIDFGNILQQYLSLYEFKVTWAKDGEEAMEVFHKNEFDICVFDVMMPKLDGFSLAEKVIELNPEMPFVFLTARSQKEDKIKGLKLGADDYIIKPFEAEELILRLQNIIKRTQKKGLAHFSENDFAIGKYQFNKEKLELTYKETVQRLTEKEAQLVQFLVQHKNQLLKRDKILQAVWGTDDFFTGRSMDVFISRLRKYFKEDSSIKIESVRGVGLEFKLDSTKK
ncbi:DNA-binding response regulator, OmpR family, contains REC and winged-helix (wHTH) domain [Tenacibaculum sp. MAR_2009_124]|uniref:response regulator transcription factor n=1 Tax=Tenacibaculum sp. MAR_2009_124 TaxID=1250059 RepID=UPI0008988DE6|nr:response regulator transcription factor [Tenacibaculum sp. MAR_2009_124]SEC30437.1 DNA-binding response regulator, OmpR family, contains REC and winged-helix (wHTH) domain [Tenacibaculum sp. MAR_2009_124]